MMTDFAHPGLSAGSRPESHAESHADFAVQSLSAAALDARLRRLRHLAWLVDGMFRIPGLRFRFGLNSLIGLVPGAGDAVLGLISLYIVNEARRLGLPRAKLARMLGNVAIEVVAGSVPVLGDLFDMTLKANLRNIAVLERHFGVR